MSGALSKSCFQLKKLKTWAEPSQLVCAVHCVALDLNPSQPQSSTIHMLYFQEN